MKRTIRLEDFYMFLLDNFPETMRWNSFFDVMANLEQLGLVSYDGNVIVFDVGQLKNVGKRKLSFDNRLKGG